MESNILSFEVLDLSEITDISDRESKNSGCGLRFGKCIITNGCCLILGRCSGGGGCRIALGKCGGK
jgi:hypothetical protein